ncbi:DUF3450 domain-containing protein [Chitinophaga nivalis]|uniref:DUF3450 domain-containing protein n=1 Tax=Chitinophaga nivalis TaxID=2991709 RepID=A0ABT3IJF4_9BACT|nr:DUF3450 domain-containing protein [Chitinophaga nivalis]MCW3466369.1 DUF3450 domain-containing protein [Chitinophaga nivalis]MCW3483940.1 DUF3450 domain-containing protein [Chitinophaga nivalis]
MKRNHLIFSCTFLLGSFIQITLQAQNTFPATGNVGIGTTSPAQKLTLDMGATRNGIQLLSDGDVNAYSDIMFSSKGATPIPGNNVDTWIISHRKDAYFSGGGSALTSLEFYGVRSGGGYYTPLIFRPDGNIILASPYQTMRSGNVGIGTLNPGNYKLAVEGVIAARKIKVTQESWADFVFHPDYQLPSLGSVESYIKIHRHLPDIPAAVEIEKNGLDLGDINKQLLQKVEELTLYMIQQQKTIDAQHQRIEKLEQHMNKRKK